MEDKKLNTRLEYLYNAYLDMTASEQELAEFYRYVNDITFETQIHELFEQTLVTQQTNPEFSDQQRSRILQNILSTGQTAVVAPPKLKLKWNPFYAVAAMIICILSLTLFFYPSGNKKPLLKIQTAKADINPGVNKAILTLSDGSSVVLGGSQHKTIAVQGKQVLSTTEQGTLVYSKHDELKNTGKTGYNTISTPKGGKFDITLPDGTKLWMNAASVIKFPVAFAASERLVEIQGEVYFEVAKDKTRPFKVFSKGQQVEVLGTHFNVEAYADDTETKTTLLEGSVKVKNNHLQSGLLKPGEQSTVNGNQNILIREVDTKEVISWKQGYFNFKETPFTDVLKILGRWYDVEIVYNGPPPSGNFNGIISRNKKLSAVILGLEQTGTARFQIKGKQLLVTNLK